MTLTSWWATRRGGGVVEEGSSAAAWCEAHGWSEPDRQIATAFGGKRSHHLADGGSGLPPPAPRYDLQPQPALGARAAKVQWLRAQYAVDLVINLADYQRFLFAEAGHPAIVARYLGTPPKAAEHVIRYWSPKADWAVTQAEVITVQPQDRTQLKLAQVLGDLDGEDAPQVWKLWHWATARDRRLIDRLAEYPRLRETAAAGAAGEESRWVAAVGFQPLGQEHDDLDKAETLALASKWFVHASCPGLDLFLLTRDCEELPAAEVTVRSGSNKNTEVFRAPHVLVAKGFTSTAFADFHVSFQDAVRGIQGPAEDRALLMFLAAYLRSDLANYFLFHTSSNWGVSRQEVHVAEMLRLPFPLPAQGHSPPRCAAIVEEVAAIVAKASEDADQEFGDREGIVRKASKAVGSLVLEYFDVDPLERALVEDTARVIIPVPPGRRGNGSTCRPSSRPRAACREAVRGRWSATCSTGGRRAGSMRSRPARSPPTRWASAWSPWRRFDAGTRRLPRTRPTLTSWRRSTASTRLSRRSIRCSTWFGA